LKLRRDPIQCTEAELIVMTSDLEQLHNDVAMPVLRETTADAQETYRSRLSKPTSRRIFLLGAGTLVGGGVLAACGGSPKKSASGTTTTVTTPSTSSPTTAVPLTGDLAVASLAASLENLGVYAYKAGLSAATAGKLGTVPPAVGTFAMTAMSQHQDHADSWNAVLKANNEPAQTQTDPTLTPTVNSMFGMVTDVTGLAELALLIENIAAQTYQVQTAKLQSVKAIANSASIMPVEMQHAAILYYVLGKYPGIQDTSGNPLAFNPTTMATS
jgi:hypothetical protein